MRKIIFAATVFSAIALSLAPRTSIASTPEMNVSVSHTVMGRVVTDKGRPISNARLILTDADNVSRVAYTSSFGYYRFDNVPSGDLYVLNVNHKGYLFSTPSHVMEIFEDKLFDFVGEINSSRGPR